MRVALGIVRWGIAFGSLGLSLLSVGFFQVVHAQSDDERARTHFEAGRSYYEQAQYEDAAREFQEAFDLSGRPELLLNLSQAEERALHYEDAIGAAQRYLELVPNAENRKTIEDRIAGLQQLKQRYDEGGPAPLSAPGALESPQPLAPGATPPAVPPTAAKPAPPAPAPAPELALSPAPSEGRFTVPAIVLMGTGGAALVGALVTGLVAHADYRSLERQCTGGLCPRAAENELDEGETLSVLSTVLTIVGVAAAGAGAALLVAGSDHPQEAGQVSFRSGPTLLSASGSVSF